MAEPSASTAPRASILVAEDEPHIRRILQAILDTERYHADLVSDGQAAIELLQGESQYGLIILDLLMPGASGLEILSRVREMAHRRSTPVMILTAKGQDTDRDRAFALGATDFVTKPFSPKKLLARIDELLGGS
jgi:DNA-binding response OmpR family regulator